MDGELLLQSKIFRVERLRYQTQSGQPLTKDVVRHPGSVAILPVLDDGQVCLIKNHRVTVATTLFEIPAGTMEPPEPALECAHRELIEETGYVAQQMIPLASFYPAPGILDEQMHLFIAKGLTKGEPAREPGEQIENYVVCLEEAKAMALDGRIQDGKTIAGILMFAATAQPSL